MWISTVLDSEPSKTNKVGWGVGGGGLLRATACATFKQQLWQSANVFWEFSSSHPAVWHVSTAARA